MIRCASLSGDMQRMRRLLAHVAGGWLVLQLCLLASVPAALCWTPYTSPRAAECACDHSAVQTCPMHPATHRDPSSDSSSCSCRSTTDPLAEIAASLLGPAAVLMPPVLGIGPMPMVGSQPVTNPQLHDQFAIPDAPPPRR
jgi:hypothetical protein